MRVLLDTHTFFWLLESPEKIPSATLTLLSDTANNLLLSLATPWELAIKTNIGKLDAAEILHWLESETNLSAYQFVETSVRQVIRAGSLPLLHRDPFDRLLAAQALDLRVPIVSSDDIFDRYGVKRIWS